MKKNINVGAGQKKAMTILWTGEENEIGYEINLAGRGAEIIMKILLLGKENHQVAVNVEIVHQKPETKSLLVVRGALWDRAKVDFNGLVRIEPGAGKADAWLAANLLLLSGQATGRAVPNLEIKENDVKAGHAATVGKVSPEEVFYLMSRGIAREAAEKLIVQGFMDSMIREFPVKLRKKYEKYQSG